jgi:hypothetical protein
MIRLETTRKSKQTGASTNLEKNKDSYVKTDDELLAIKESNPTA